MKRNTVIDLIYKCPFAFFGLCAGKIVLEIFHCKGDLNEVLGFS